MLRTALKNYLHIGIFVSIILLLSACGSDGKKEVDKTPHGRIVYSVSYPEIPDDNFMKAMLPKESEMVFRGNMYRQIAGNATVNTTFVVDTKEEKLKVALKNLGQKEFALCSKEDVRKELSEFPEITYLSTTRQDSVAGYPVTVVTTVSADMNKEIELAYTDKIPLKNANWFNPYNEIDGVLLKYSIRYYGVLMSFEATEVDLSYNVTDKDFEFDKDCVEITYPKLKDEINELFKIFAPTEKSEDDDWDSDDYE